MWLAGKDNEAVLLSQLELHKTSALNCTASTKNHVSGAIGPFLQWNFSESTYKENRSDTIDKAQ